MAKGIGRKFKKRTPNGQERCRQMRRIRSCASGDENNNVNTNEGITSPSRSVNKSPCSPSDSGNVARINEPPPTPSSTMKGRQLFDDLTQQSSHLRKSSNFGDEESPAGCEGKTNANTPEDTTTQIVNSIASALDLRLEDTSEKRKAALALLARYSSDVDLEEPTQIDQSRAASTTPARSNYRSPLATLMGRSDLTPTPYNPRCFEKKKNGELRTNPETSGKAAKYHAVSQLQAVYDKIGGAEDQLVALEGLLRRKKNADVASGLILRVLSKEQSLATQCFEQIRAILKTARSEGKRSNDSETFLNTLFMALAPDIGPNGKAKSVMSMNRSAKLFNIPQSSFKRRMTKGIKLRAELLSGASNAFVKQYRKHYPTPFTVEFIRDLHHFILNRSNNVVRSPNMNHTVRVRDPMTGAMRREQKCYYRHGMRDLHNEIVERFPQAKDASGNIILSDTTLRSLLPKQLSRLTESQKETCGCVGCIAPKSMTTNLIAFRTNTMKHLESQIPKAPPGAIRDRRIAVRDLYKAEAFPNNNRLFHSAKEAVNMMTCPKVVEHGLYKTSCALGRCTECPTLNIPQIEKGTSQFDRMISFHVYKVHYRCTLHGPLHLERQQVHSGDDYEPKDKNNPASSSSTRKKQSKKKPSTRKKTELVCTVCIEMKNSPDYDSKRHKLGKISSKSQLTLKREPIGIFHRDYYLPQLASYRYHLHLLSLLGKHHCIDMRQQTFANIPGSVLTQRDYADHLAADFNNAIQSEHFGDHVTVSMEGCTIKFENEQSEMDMHYYACVSDDNRQDARTTFLNTEKVIHALRSITTLNLLKRKESTLYEVMDGCGKQYRSGNSLFLMSALATKLELTLDRMIQAPGHGKGDCDSQGGVDKTWVKNFFLTVFSAEQTDEEIAKHQRYGINSHVITVDGIKASFADLVVGILNDPCRNRGVKGHLKHKKREEAAKISLRRYFAMHHGNTDSQNNSAVPLIKTTYRCVDSDFGSTKKGEKHNGLMGHYHIVASHNIGIGRVAVRRYPCACQSCFKQSTLAWLPNVPPEQQPKFQPNKDCDYISVFGEYNDWKIVRIRMDNKENDKDEIEALYDNVLNQLEQSTAEHDIEPGNFGAYQTDDERTDGYYLVRFEGSAYALQHLATVEGCGSMPAGTLVCEAVYWNPVPSARFWYTPPTVITQSHKKLFRVRYFVDTNVLLNEFNKENNRMPNGLDRKIKERSMLLGAMKLTETSHDTIMEEIGRRALLDYYEGGTAEAASDDELEKEREEEGVDDRVQPRESDNESDMLDNDSDSDCEVIPAPKRRKFIE